ncbi:hypothetical protein HMI54_012963 [Coelomomyces lativittatus]|nr:hypothetical protein HMI54_012963 [Coelomomyces lativittatus]
MIGTPFAKAKRTDTSLLIACRSALVCTRIVASIHSSASALSSLLIPSIISFVILPDRSVLTRPSCTGSLALICCESSYLRNFRQRNPPSLDAPFGSSDSWRRLLDPTGGICLKSPAAITMNPPNDSSGLSWNRAPLRSWFLATVQRRLFSCERRIGDTIDISSMILKEREVTTIDKGRKNSKIATTPNPCDRNKKHLKRYPRTRPVVDAENRASKRSALHLVKGNRKGKLDRVLVVCDRRLPPRTSDAKLHLSSNRLKREEASATTLHHKACV